MKKIYIAPFLNVTLIAGRKLIAASIAEIGGNSGLGKGGKGGANDEADARAWDIWGNGECKDDGYDY